MNITDILTDIKQKLESVPDVTTCEIGLESDLSPEDYPIIRIVPTDVKATIEDRLSGQRTLNIIVYLGYNLHEYEGGLEAIYSSLFAMEDAVRERMTKGAKYKPRFVETLYDEDVSIISHYKVSAMRFEVLYLES